MKWGPAQPTRGRGLSLDTPSQKRAHKHKRTGEEDYDAWKERRGGRGWA
jgi:hypothetical protein